MLARIRFDAVRKLALALLVITLTVLLATVAPSIHTSDSPELAAAAATLGIPHAPGYGFYMLVAHLFTWLPVGDVAFRLNLLSVFATALTAPLLFRLLFRLVDDTAIACGSTLLVLWSQGIWFNGLVAEVYALQLLTVCTVVDALLQLIATPAIATREKVDWPLLTRIGVLFGIAVAIHPASVLFAPGLVVAFILKRVSLIGSLCAGLISISIAAMALLYLPIRYAANPAMNAAGDYAESCSYQAVNLQSASGLAWFVSGRQFERLFFAEGWLASVRQVTEGLRWFWVNFAGVGVAVGLVGLWRLWRQRTVFLVWVVLFIPYSYFFVTYGANDRFAMLSPALALWAVPMALGFRGLVQRPWMCWIPLGLALVVLVVHYPLVNLRDNTTYRDRTILALEQIPQQTAVFAHWHDIVALRYFQITEGKREDIDLYNLFFFEQQPRNVQRCVNQYLAEERPVIFLETAHQAYLDMNLYDFQTIFISQRYPPPLYLQLITYHSGEASQ